MAYNPNAEPPSPYWGDGRAVVRRPEVNNKILDQSYVIRNREEANKLSETTRALVVAEQQITSAEFEEERARILALAVGLGIDVEATD